MELIRDKESFLNNHHFNDYDIKDEENLLVRVVVPHQVNDGDICNVYFKSGTKLGLEYDTSKPLIEQLEQIKEVYKNLQNEPNPS